MRTKIHTQETLAKYLHEEGDCLIWTGGCSGKSRVPYIVHAGKSTPALQCAGCWRFSPDTLMPSKRLKALAPRGFGAAHAKTPAASTPRTPSASRASSTWPG